MNQQKGFSLIEVLVSLILVSTVALVLVEQQSQTKQLLHQMITHANASHVLDSIDENYFISAKKIALNVDVKPRIYGHLK